MRPRSRNFLIVIALLGGLAAGIWYARRPQPVPVAVHTVTRGTVEATVANTRAGTVKACRRAQVAPQVGGRIVRLPIRRGDRVAEGALLLELWNADIQAQLELAETALVATTARSEQACLSAQLAVREAARLERLSSEGIVDESTLDRARAEKDTTDAACRAARAALDQARAQIGVARAELERTVLRAPFAGIVAELNAELGEVVIPSPPGIPTRPAIDLIEEGCLYVVAPIDEVDAPRVRPGQHARVSLDAFPGRAFDATVVRVAPFVLDVERQARTVDVEVEVQDAEALSALLPGYSADVEVLLEKREAVPFVPTAALIDGNKVWVLAGDRVEERTIETGVSNWERTEVRAGLAEGDRVVLSIDREGVAPGALVRAEAGRG